MNGRRRLSDRKYVLLLIACLAVSALGCEWSWGLVNPFVLNAATRLLVLPAIAALALADGGIRIPSQDRGLAQLVGASAWLFVVVIILGQLFASEHSGARPDFYVTLLLAPLVGIIGYSYARQGRDVLYAYRSAARLMAVIGLCGFMMPTAEGGQSFPSLSVGFPVALFVIFGYCWFLFAWLNSAGLAWKPLLGLGACSLYVLLPFHKPIVFSTGAATLFISAHFMMRFSTSSGFKRFAGLIAAASVAFAAANAASGNAIFAHYEQQFYSKILHARPGEVADDTEDLLRQASAKRFDLWGLAIDNFSTSPWIGNGFGQRFSLDSEDNSNVHVHNGYLDLLQSVGVLGTLPALVVVGLWARSVFRMTRAPHGGAERHVPATAYIISLMAYNSGGVITSFYTVTAFGCFFMGLTVGDHRLRSREATGVRLPTGARSREDCHNGE